LKIHRDSYHSLRCPLFVLAGRGPLLPMRMVTDQETGRFHALRSEGVEYLVGIGLKADIALR
jgi:hypothetical protein